MASYLLVLVSGNEDVVICPNTVRLTCLARKLEYTIYGTYPLSAATLPKWDGVRRVTTKCVCGAGLMKQLGFILMKATPTRLPLPPEEAHFYSRRTYISLGDD